MHWHYGSKRCGGEGVQYVYKLHNNVYWSEAIMSPIPASGSLWVENLVTTSAYIAVNTMRNCVEVLPECLDLVPLQSIKNEC